MHPLFPSGITLPNRKPELFRSITHIVERLLLFKTPVAKKTDRIRLHPMAD